MTRVRVIVDRVSKTYRDRVGREVPALQEVSLTVEPEEFVAILGRAQLGRARAETTANALSIVVRFSPASAGAGGPLGAGDSRASGSSRQC